MSGERFSPYQGLVPFGEEDALFFFGREGEREIVISNLLGTRLTLLYGASGVGKSSLLRAGVAYQLKERARAQRRADGPPPWVVVPFSAWSDEPVAPLLAATRAALAGALNVAPDDIEPPAGGLLESLRGWSERYDTRLLFILDQFEEYFLYHEGQNEAGAFGAELPRALNDPLLRAHWLLSLREDALATLDAFKGRVPHLFGNLLRVEHLDEGAARDAIERPLEQYNWLLADPGEEVEIEPELVTALLAQVRAGQVALVEGEASATAEAAQAGRIEAPFLQLVLQRLWAEEQTQGSRVLRRETLERLGGAAQIVRTHLDSAMAALPAEEQRVAASLFHHLVTPSGTKIALSVSDLADYAGEEEAALAPMLARLASMEARILRPVAPPLDQPDAARYEIFHDVLAPAILDWRTRYVQEAERVERDRKMAEAIALQRAEARAEAERRNASRLRRLLALSSLLLMLALVAAGVAVASLRTASRERGRADEQAAAAATAQVQATAVGNQVERQTRIAQSQAFAGEALIAFSEENDDRARLLTLAAAQRYPDAYPLLIERVLSEAMADVPGRPLDRAGGYGNLAWHPDSSQLLTISQGGGTNIWDVRTGERVSWFAQEASGTTSAAAWRADGSQLVTGTTDGFIRVWEAARGELIREWKADETAITTIAWSPDASQVVSGSVDGTAHLWEVASGQSVRVLEGHERGVAEVAWSAQGLIATRSPERVGRLWDARGDGTVQVLQGGPEDVAAMAWSPDGGQIATVSGVYGSARVWDAITGQRIHLLEERDYVRGSVAWSPNGAWLVTAGGLGDGTGTARIWDADKGESIHVLTGHTGWIGAVAWSPDSRLIATASWDDTARVWDAASGEPLRLLEGHTGDGVAVAWSPDGSTLATGSTDAIVRLWPATLLLVAGLTERVCNVTEPDAIRATIPDWRGCDAELAAVADDLATYKALTGE